MSTKKTAKKINKKPIKKNKSLEWINHCAKSNGSSFMVPQEFQNKAEKFLKEAETLTALKKEMIKREAEFGMMRDNFWYDLRKKLESDGAKDVFEKNIDFDVDAKNDGFLVVNLYDDRQGPPLAAPMRM